MKKQQQPSIPPQPAISPENQKIVTRYHEAIDDGLKDWLKGPASRSLGDCILRRLEP